MGDGRIGTVTGQRRRGWWSDPGRRPCTREDAGPLPDHARRRAPCRWRRSGSCSRPSPRSMWPTSWLPGRLQITKGKVGYGDGTIEVQGSLGLPPRLGTPGDHGVVTLHQIPLEHTQQVQDFRSQGAATLHLRTTCNGQVELQVTPSGQLQGGCKCRWTRLPARYGKATASWRRWKCRPYFSPPRCRPHARYEHWEIPSLRLQGQGTAVALTNMQVHRTAVTYRPARRPAGASLRGGELWCSPWGSCRRPSS